MENMVINIDVIIDAKAQGSMEVVRDIVQMAEKTVKAGKTVTVQQEYKNAKPTWIETLSSIEEVDAWRAEMGLSELK